ncbi:hypothetical protein LPJ53_006249 [Coemansia erecta]|uniref:Septin-type G domain-containing protein n=1 Tax=Coemansia erecta TaxID=147472 RepID=A0A9W8CP98_9FUNG|nr:hypothetical protein LPJ53_006249 [Coemansia erecta]
MAHHAPEAFNILVAGRRGSGKSTFLQTLCDSLPTLSIQWLSEGDKQLFTHTSDSPLQAEEVLDPFCVFDAASGTRAIRRCGMLVRDHGHARPLLVELIDTPGIADSQDMAEARRDVEVVAWEIERRLHGSLDDEVRAARRSSRKTRGRGHVHAVVYMVPAPVCASAQTDSACHRMDDAVDLLSDTDLLAVQRLARHASVIVAVGKSDTLEQADRRLLRNRTFFSDAHSLLQSPASLFAFADVPQMAANMPSEMRREVEDFGARILARYPFLLCGSKHVEEWQQMRLPEYQATSMSHVSVADWRTLATEHNRPSSRGEGMITQGIFRERRTRSRSRTVEPPQPATAAPLEEGEGHADGVSITRMGQRREVQLVRRFPWGTLQLTNPAHCDFALLVDVLLHSFRRSLRAWCDVYYERYRSARMAGDPAFRSVAQGIEEYLDSTLNKNKVHEEGQRSFVDTQEARAFVFRAGGGGLEADSPTTAVFSSRSPVDAGSPHRSSVATTLAATAQGNSFTLPKPPAHAARLPPPRRHTVGSRTLHPTFI